MKKSIIINATGSAKWMGGLYYKRNILFMLLQNRRIVERYRFVVITEKDNVPLFEPFRGKVKIVTIENYSSEKKLKATIISQALLNRADIIFPFRSRKICDFLNIRDVAWIPDFQELYYPSFFSDEEVNKRYRSAKEIGNDKMPLVLSSKACLEDYYKSIGFVKKSVYVLPFVSYIENEVKHLTDTYVNEVCQKYNLTQGKYAIVSNQFWPHKNHIVVLEALDLIVKRGEAKIPSIVFTGKLPSKPYNHYEKELMGLCENRTGEEILILGLVERVEQLALMKAAAFVIQPSLFEGWGTVLEDAKVLDKTVLLSDIPVHREQRNGKSILFNPNNPAELAELILNEYNNMHEEDLESGIQNMYERAYEYSKAFEELIKNEIRI